MRTRVVHLVNPAADSFTTRPVYLNRALYSPLAGLLAVAAAIPRERYEVVLTDENIEPIDFDAKVDLVGVTAMTSYARRGYEIADEFRRRGVPVVMGGVHPSFMPAEALRHADAVVVGEAELVMSKVLDDLERGELRGAYKADRLHPMTGLPLPRYDLLKRGRYVNRTYIQTSRGCHHACAFCAEQLMYGLRFRHRPIDDVLREVDACGEDTIALNDADFFGDKQRAAALMRGLRTRGIRWQAGVNSREARDERLLELAAESGCYMLSVGFESISRETLRAIHKLQNSPDSYRALVERLHRFGILVFGLFMFGFDGDGPTVFEDTARFAEDAAYDVCAFSVLTPYPGTITWYEMLRDERIVSFDWDEYDQGHVVYRPTNLAPEQLIRGHAAAYRRFYAWSSIARRFPWRGGRSRMHWSVYNLFFRSGEVVGRVPSVAPASPPSARPPFDAIPPVAPEHAAWRDLIAAGTPSAMSSQAGGASRSDPSR